MDPEQILLERPDEPLGTAVPLGGADEGWRTLDAEKRDFLLEVLGHVLRSVIVAHGETARNVLGEPAEVPANALADRFQRLEPGGAGMGVDPDAFA